MPLIIKMKEVIIMGSSIEISTIGKVGINVVNGVEFSHMYFNATDKVIKYITFAYVPFNSVGDPVRCTVSKKCEASGQITGPLEPYTSHLAKWENLWYNGTVIGVKIVRIHVQYMDGTEETINGDDAGDMYDKNSVHYEKKVIPEQKAAEERKAQEEIKKKEWAEQEKNRAAEQRRKNIKTFSNICLGIAIFFLLGAFGSDTGGALPVILGIAAVAAAAFAVMRFKPEWVETVIDKIKAKKN